MRRPTFSIALRTSRRSSRSFLSSSTMQAQELHDPSHAGDPQISRVLRFFRGHLVAPVTTRSAVSS